MSIRRERACVLLLVALAASRAGAQTSATPPAQADGTTNLQEVVITGTNIRGVAATGQNVIGITREEVTSSPAVTTLDLLRQVPQIVNLGADDSNTTGQGGAFNATGGTGVNIRGLGPLATLTLMDGYRLPAQGSQGQFTDPSVLPTIAIERLEVIADGASAIYGADAIAGVVNMITRRRFEGAETQVRYGVGDEYHNESYGQIVGKSWGSGGVVLAGEYTSRTQLFAADRDWFASDLRARGASDFRSTLCSPGNILIGTTSYAIPATGVTQATANQLVAGTSNRCDNAKAGGILPSQMRTNGYLYAHQDLNSWLTAFTEVLYYDRQGVPVTGPFTANLTVPSTNPFFVSPVPGRTSVSLQYAFPGELARRVIRRYFAHGYNALAGIDVKLPADWQAQIAYRDGYTSDVTKNSRNLNTTALTQEINNPASNFNPFNPNAAIPEATLATLFSRTGFIAARMLNQDVYAKADGRVFDLPGGAVRLAVGGSYRKERIAANLNISGAPVPSGNKRHSYAGFAEAFVPLVGTENEKPFVQRLDLSVAGRYENYSDFGTTVNPKVGITWKPIRDLTLRGTYGTSFRAPTLVESDPLSIGTGLYPINFRDPRSASPTGFTQGFSIGGGNADIQPETATTYSFGAEFKPSAVPGLALNLTHFIVTYEDQILPLQGDSTVLQNEVFYSQFIIRNPTQAQIDFYRNQNLPLNGVIDFSNVQAIIIGTTQNRGVTKASGFDYAVSYQFETPLGDAAIGADGTVFTKVASAASPTAPAVDVLNTYLNPLRFRTRVFGELRRGPWNARATVFYQNRYDNPIAPILKEAASYTTIDLHLGYGFDANAPRLLRDLSLSVDAQNVFDKDPPIFDLSGGYDPHAASAIGRVVNFSLRKQW